MIYAISVTFLASLIIGHPAIEVQTMKPASFDDLTVNHQKLFGTSTAFEQAKMSIYSMADELNKDEQIKNIIKTKSFDELGQDKKILFDNNPELFGGVKESISINDQMNAFAQSFKNAISKELAGIKGKSFDQLTREQQELFFGNKKWFEKYSTQEQVMKSSILEVYTSMIRDGSFDELTPFQKQIFGNKESSFQAMKDTLKLIDSRVEDSQIFNKIYAESKGFKAAADPRIEILENLQAHGITEEEFKKLLYGHKQIDEFDKKYHELLKSAYQNWLRDDGYRSEIGIEIPDDLPFKESTQNIMEALNFMLKERNNEVMKKYFTQQPKVEPKRKLSLYQRAMKKLRALTSNNGRVNIVHNSFQ